jgi:hypothetical protein
MLQDRRGRFAGSYLRRSRPWTVDTHHECDVPGYGRFEPMAPTLAVLAGEGKSTKRRAKLSAA